MTDPLRCCRPAGADSGGYQALVTWAETHGRIEAFGIEGTGSYGAGLASTVRRAGHRIVEVNRGDRRTRRAVGKSDTVDAESVLVATVNFPFVATENRTL